MAPPQGLMRPALSSSATLRPRRARSVRRGCSRRSAANYNDIENFFRRHDLLLLPAPRQMRAARDFSSALAARGRALAPAARAIWLASIAEKRNSIASTMKTIA